MTQRTTDDPTTEQVDAPPAELPTAQHPTVNPAPIRSQAKGWLIALGGAALLMIGLLGGLALGPARQLDPVVIAPQAIGGEPIQTADVADIAALVAPSVVQIEAAEGLGSGVIFDTSGLILTAAHVVEGSDEVRVRLLDGRLVIGEVLGAHATTDVAVVAIDGEGFPAAVLGYGTTPRVGETAVALGSPFGFEQTVTAGIVSATGRNVNGVPMVQTDAAINPGNSGGPLVDGLGRVIGINDVIFTRGGGSDGIGFAISIDVAIVVAEQILAGEAVQLASLGVETIPNTTGEGGAVVRQVIPESPADQAGLVVGDRIVAVGGTTVLDPGELFAAIVSSRPGAQVEIGLVRDGRQLQVTAELIGIER